MSDQDNPSQTPAATPAAAPTSTPDASTAATTAKRAASRKDPTISQVVVQIDRDSTVSIPVTCYEYEVDVLKEIHGELNVREISSKDVSIPSSFTAADAYAQLLRKYRQHTKEVKAVYRGPQQLARAFDLPYKKGDDQAVSFQQAEIVDNSQQAKVAQQ